MRQFSFSKTDRLLRRNEFLNIQKTGHKHQDRYFIVAYSPGRSDRCRLGITITRKTGSAVCRNRIKRGVREFFRLNRHRLSKSWDINVIAKREAAFLSSEQIHSSLQDLFSRIEDLR